MTRPLVASWVATFVGIAGFLVFNVLPGGVNGHVYLMEPVSRNFYFTSAFQTSDFPDINYCPHCYQSRGPMAVRARAEANTPADVLEKYGGGDWPHRAAFNLGELASNGNFLEPQEISVRHGICGDPEQTAAEGTNTFGRENSIYPVLGTYEEGAIIEMKVVVSTFHWGHFEYFICDTADLDDGEDGVVTQECFNKHPLSRVADDYTASPIDPKHPGRYFVDPPCRESETDQTKTDGAAAGYLVTGRYHLPDGLSCTRCVVQMIYYTGNACRQPGYEEFMPTSVPEGCAPLVSDWVHLDPPPCGEGFPYPEEFWNCADIAITAGSVNACLDSTSDDYRCSGTTIDLINCGLTESDVGDLRGCFEATGQLDAITKIYLRDNDITWLPEDLFSDMVDLVTINLRGNCNLDCIPALPRDDTEVILDDCNAEVEATQCGDVTIPTPAPAAPVMTLSPITLVPDDDGGDGSCPILVGAFGQCGGLDWAGSTCCMEGYACEDLAETFSQCLPAPEDGLQDSWEQCGGEGWSGSTECWSGADCVVRNQWYSQCIPMADLSICSTRIVTVGG